jgi:hypothetical protein
LIPPKLNQCQKRRGNYCELFCTCTPPHDATRGCFFSLSVHHKWKPYPSLYRQPSRIGVQCANGKFTFGSRV